MTVEDALDDLRRKQRQPQHARHVGWIDLLAGSEFGDGGEVARIEHALPAVGAGHGADHGAVTCGPNRSECREPVRRDNRLRPPCLRNVRPTLPVTVVASGLSETVLSITPRPARHSVWPAQVGYKGREPFGAQRDADPFLRHVDPLDVEMDNARLLSREDFFAEGPTPVSNDLG